MSNQSNYSPNTHNNHSPNSNSSSRENDPSDKRFYSFFAFRENREENQQQQQHPSRVVEDSSNSNSTGTSGVSSGGGHQNPSELSGISSSSSRRNESNRYVPRNTTLSTKKAGSGYASHWKLNKQLDQNSNNITTAASNQQQQHQHQQHQRNNPSVPIQHQQYQHNNVYSIYQNPGNAVPIQMMTQQSIVPQQQYLRPYQHMSQQQQQQQTNNQFSNPIPAPATQHVQQQVWHPSNSSTQYEVTVVPRYQMMPQDQVIHLMYRELFPQERQQLLSQESFANVQVRKYISIKELLN
jgi:hypothetical protein